MKIAFFSTDWTSEDVPDPEATAITGKPQFIPGKKTLTFGGTFLMRGAMPGMELKKHGYECFLSWRLGDSPDGALTAMDTEGEWHTPDILWLQRHMGQDFDQVIRRARATGQRIIQDIDDSFGNGILPKTNLAHQTTDPVNNPSFNREHYYKNIAASSAVIASTLPLYKEMERLGVPVYLCRNMVDMERWPQLDPGTNEAIGWIGGIAWRANDMQVLKPFLPEFLEDVKMPFYHGGDSQDPNVPKAWNLIGIDPRAVKCIAHPLVHVAQYPRIWQPLAISLIPLEDCKFNHAKCVESSMRVFKTNGICRVSDLRVGDAIWSAKGWTYVQATENQPRKPGVEIRTANGRVLQVSPEHRLWVNDTWRAAGQIKPGDTLLGVAGGRTGTTEYVKATWPADSRISRDSGRSMDFLDATDGPQIILNERWGRFLGLFVGDGCAGQNTAITISCDGQDSDLIELVMDDIRSFGLHPITQSITTWDGKPVRRRSVGASSANLVRFLYGIGFVTWTGENIGKSRQHKVLAIPEVIWCSPATVQAAFLSGLFEADGTSGRPSVSFSTKSETLARDVQLLLSTFGIESFVKETWNTAKTGGQKFQSYRLRTRRAGADVFEKEIGFLSRRKRAKLADVTCRPHSNAYIVPTWVDTVVSVTTVEMDTIDIQTDFSEFVVEGLRSHNSSLKALESSACGLPFIASDMPEQRWFVEHGGVGRLAKNWKPKTWVQHLDELLDPEVRRAEGKLNREHAFEFDIKKTWIQWDEVFREVAA